MKNHYIIFLVCCIALLQSSVLHAQTYKALRTLSGHPGQVQNIRFSPDGKLLASGDAVGKVFIWEVATGKIVRILNAHTSRVNEVTFNPTGTLLVSASYDGSARVWNVATGQLQGTYYNKCYVNNSLSVQLSFAAFSADSKYIFFAGDGGAVMKAKLGKDSMGNLFQATPLYSLVKADIHGNTSSYRATGGALSYDGRAALVSHGNTVLAIDMNTGQLLKTFVYPGQWLNDVILGAKPHQISTWSEDGYVTIWDYASTRVVKKIKAGDANDYSVAAYNTAGTLMVTGASGINANVWDVEKGSHLATLVGHTQVVRLARFSPKENIIATASYDGTIKIWKVDEPEEKPKPEPKIDPKPATRDTVYIEKKVIVRDTVYITKIDTVYKEPKKIGDPVVMKPEDGIDEEKLEIGKTFNLKHLYFEQSDHTLMPESSDQLQEVINLLKKYPSMVIQLEGHTDNIGDPKKNLSLSQRRVVTVKNYLVDFGGIDENRIMVKAYGEERPIASNDNEESRKLNRRVEMRILKL